MASFYFDNFIVIDFYVFSTFESQKSVYLCMFFAFLIGNCLFLQKKKANALFLIT